MASSSEETSALPSSIDLLHITEEEEETSPINRSWSHLPKEMLQLISSKIPSIADYLHFRSVCPSWRSAANPAAAALPPQIPRLLLPYDPTSSARSLAGLLHGTTSAFDFPETRNKIVCGSSFGWLALTDATDAALSLFNPLTGAHINLPPLSSIPLYRGPAVSRLRGNLQQQRNADGIIDESENMTAWISIRKGYPWRVSLSASPSDDRCVVAVTLSVAAEFALYVLGSEDWTVWTTGLPWPVQFFTFHNGVLYLFDDFKSCVALDVAKNKRMSIAPPDDSFKVDKFYVVKTDAELLMVLCYRPPPRVKSSDDDDDDDDGREQKRVRVFELEITEEQFKWVEVSSMAGSAIFLSGTHSSVVRVAEFPGCREDCIYFSDVRGSPRIEDGEPDVYYLDVFDMKQNKYELMTVPWRTTSITKGLHSATWFAPSLI